MTPNSMCDPNSCTSCPITTGKISNNVPKVSLKNSSQLLNNYALRQFQNEDKGQFSHKKEIIGEIHMLLFDIELFYPRGDKLE